MKRPDRPLDAALLKEQFEAFRQKFGREPTPADPIFFDPSSDEPVPISDSAHAEAIEEIAIALDEIGAPPAIIYAVRKTGRIVTEENQKYLTASEQEEWETAICEYHARIADEDRSIDLCYSLPDSALGDSRSLDERSVAERLSSMSRAAYSSGTGSFPLEGTFLNAWLSLVSMRLGVSHSSSDAFRTCLGTNMNEVQSVLDKLAGELDKRQEAVAAHSKVKRIEEARSLPESWFGQVPPSGSAAREQTKEAFEQIQQVLADCRESAIPVEAVERMLFRYWLRTWVINNDLPEAYFQNLDLHLDEAIRRVNQYMAEYARPLQRVH